MVTLILCPFLVIRILRPFFGRPDSVSFFGHPNSMSFSHRFSERIYEEHEPLVENLMLWTRDSKNKLYYVERPERLLLFERPEIYHPEYNSISTLEDELSQNSLVEVSFPPRFQFVPGPEKGSGSCGAGALSTTT